MLMSFRVLAVLVLGCCLISIVAADCGGGCSYCSVAPPGGWGAPAKDKYWGMSAEDIGNYLAAHPKSETTTKSKAWIIPAVVLPSSNAGKFASLSEYKSKIGDSQSISSVYSGTLIPDIMTKPDFSGSTTPVISITKKIDGITSNVIFF